MYAVTEFGPNELSCGLEHINLDRLSKWAASVNRSIS